MIENRLSKSYPPALTVAALIVVFAGLRAAQALLLPFLFSIVLAMLALPIVLWLERKGCPRALSIFTVVLAAIGILVLGTALTANSVQQFTSLLPSYQEDIRSGYLNMVQWLQEHGVQPRLLDLQEQFDPAALLSLVGATLGGVLDILSNVILVAITMGFILAEAAGFSEKVQRAFSDGKQQLEEWRGLVTSVQRYLVIKTLTSALTGLSISVLVGAAGLELPVLWGLLAFVLNFIPTIGSIVAAIPALLLALVQFGVFPTLGILTGYLVVNMTISNILEPRILGENLGLSPMVVFLSLVFWGWMWGPAGMLLSVPLTVMVRDVMDYRESTRWIAILLGPSAAPTNPAPKI